MINQICVPLQLNALLNTCPPGTGYGSVMRVRLYFTSHAYGIEDVSMQLSAHAGRVTAIYTVRSKKAIRTHPCPKSDKSHPHPEQHLLLLWSRLS